MSSKRARSKRSNTSTKQRIECFKAALYSNQIQAPSVYQIKGRWDK